MLAGGMVQLLDDSNILFNPSSVSSRFSQRESGGGGELGDSCITFTSILVSCTALSSVGHCNVP